MTRTRRISPAVYLTVLLLMDRMLAVMPALVAGIHDFHLPQQDVDGRDLMREDGASRLSPGHDESERSLERADCWPSSRCAAQSHLLKCRRPRYDSPAGVPQSVC